MSGVTCTTLVGGVDFDGTTPALGLFRFTIHNNVARTTRVVLASLSYVEINGAPVTTNVQFWAVKPGGLPSEKMPLGDGVAASGLLNVNLVGRLRLCGIILPREPGDGGAFWDVQVITQNKIQTATACLDYVLCPYPESHERGSPDK